MNHQPSVVIKERRTTESRNDFEGESAWFFEILDKGSNNRQLDYDYRLLERVLGRFCLLGHFKISLMSSFMSLEMNSISSITSSLV